MVNRQHNHHTIGCPLSKLARVDTIGFLQKDFSDNDISVETKISGLIGKLIIYDNSKQTTSKDKIN